MALLNESGGTLSVTCRSGLANRLRVLTSGLALAEATGRSFEMLWPYDNKTCGASFTQLFDSDLPVIDVTSIELEQRIEAESWWFGDAMFEDLPDFVDSAEADLRCIYVSWLVDPEQSAEHRRILDRAYEILAELQPVEEILRLVEASTSKLTHPSVGVHIRRGDFLLTRPEVVGNLDLALEVVESEVARGAVSVFLATDDGAGVSLGRRSGPGEPQGVRTAFRNTFGTALIESQPRSLDRASPIAVADAVVDLWTLRATDVIVGTSMSSFSELAAVGREVRRIDIGGAATPLGLIHRAVLRLGLAPAVESLGRRVYGRDIPASALLRRTGEPFRRIRRRVQLAAARFRSPKLEA